MYKLIIYITIAIILVYVIVRSFKKKSFKRKIVNKTRTEKILKIINVFAWIFFVGPLLVLSFLILLFTQYFNYSFAIKQIKTAFK